MGSNHISSPLALRGDVDPSVAPGVPAPIGCLYQNDSNGLFWTKIDDGDTDWQGYVLAPVDPAQVFQYVCTGAEGATIAIGAVQGFVVRSTANYTVQITLRRPLANAIKIATVQGAVGVGGFTVELSAPVEVDDVLCFTVEDLT